MKSRFIEVFSSLSIRLGIALSLALSYVATSKFSNYITLMLAKQILIAILDMLIMQTFKMSEIFVYIPLNITNKIIGKGNSLMWAKRLTTYCTY